MSVSNPLRRDFSEKFFIKLSCYTEGEVIIFQAIYFSFFKFIAKCYLCESLLES